MKQAIIQTEKLAIGYGSKGADPAPVAEGIAVTLHCGECVCLVGPNGVGKSTLIKTMTGMLRPLGGRVMVDGRDISSMKPVERAQLLSVVLTERIHVGALSAFALVSLGRHPYTGWAGKLTDKDRRAVEYSLQAVGVEDLAARNVAELSDGERQKVMIARALAQEPRAMILDEPTAFLDLPRKVEVMRLMRRFAHLEDRAVLLSTHDLDLALRSADHIWLMSREGTMAVGAPEDLVISGAFEEAFRSEGASFDRESGSFTDVEEPLATAVVKGEPLAVNWTGRALARIGIRVLAGEERGSQTTAVKDVDMDAAPIRVEAALENDAVQWRCHTGAQVSEGTTLESLVTRVREVVSTRNGGPTTNMSPDPQS